MKIPIIGHLPKQFRYEKLNVTNTLNGSKPSFGYVPNAAQSALMKKAYAKYPQLTRYYLDSIIKNTPLTDTKSSSDLRDFCLDMIVKLGKIAESQEIKKPLKELNFAA